MDSKISFIEDFERGDLSVAELCRRHGISRSCGNKWIKRFKEFGHTGLEALSRKPRRSPLKSTDDMEARVVEIRKAHPVWGGRKIQKVLQREGQLNVPAPSTITNILRRHELLGLGMRQGVPNVKSFERSEPNDLWQMDFKGHFGMGNQRRCYPLTALDDHSRFNIILEACHGESNDDVRPVLERAFQRYGLPRQILCDHGNPWGKVSADREVAWLTRFEVWLMRLGVQVIHGRAMHPQTQGKEERFHRTLDVEVLLRTSLWRDAVHCQNAFNEWQHVYNTKRPHESLDYKTPSEVYRLSQRSYPENLPDEEIYYLEEDQIKRVKSKGEITFKNHYYYIGGGFIGRPIALRPRCPLGGIEEELWDVYYCWKCIGTINPKEASKQKGRYHPIS